MQTNQDRGSGNQRRNVARSPLAVAKSSPGGANPGRGIYPKEGS